MHGDVCLPGLGQSNKRKCILGLLLFMAWQSHRRRCPTEAVLPLLPRRFAPRLGRSCPPRGLQQGVAGGGAKPLPDTLDHPLNCDAVEFQLADALQLQSGDSAAL